MRGEQGNVRPVNFRNAVLVQPAGVQVRFAMVGAHQKTARTARRIEHHILRLADAKGVHHVHQVFVGVMLAKLVPFLRRNQALENAA